MSETTREVFEALLAEWNEQMGLTIENRSWLWKRASHFRELGRRRAEWLARFEAAEGQAVRPYVFARVSATGAAIFHPPGEPDMQSSFALPVGSTLRLAEGPEPPR